MHRAFINRKHQIPGRSEPSLVSRVSKNESGRTVPRDSFRGVACGEQCHVVGKVLVVEAVLGQEAGAAAVGAYAVLAGVEAEHGAAAGLEFVVVSSDGQFLLGVVRRVEGKRYVAVGCEYMGIVIDGDVITVAAASVLLGADVVFVEIPKRPCQEALCLSE